jgi:hypothetical protein
VDSWPTTAKVSTINGTSSQGRIPKQDLDRKLGQGDLHWTLYLPVLILIQYLTLAKKYFIYGPTILEATTNRCSLHAAEAEIRISH